MDYTTVTVERQGPIAYVWLNRPERRNALNGQMLEDLVAVFTELQRAFATPVVVLGGRGPSFCAGADRKDPPGGHLLQADGVGMRERRYVSQLGPRALRAIGELEAVTIARLHGHAVGGGLALALACDLRIAAAGTTFHIPEVDLGVPLGWGALPRLAAEVGACRAKELILLCEPFDAAAAERYGLLNRVVTEDALDATVTDWATRIAAKPNGAVHITKTQFRAYAHVVALGDAGEADGDLTAAAGREQFARFLADPKR
ncbi:MAG: enoyl-CoA hydratase/isomerase family protein [Candidatus Binatia bacterium]